MTNWPRGGYAAGNTPASELKPPPEALCSKSDSPDRWLDLDRLIAIKWGDTVIDPGEVVYILRETE